VTDKTPTSEHKAQDQSQDHKQDQKQNGNKQVDMQIEALKRMALDALDDLKAKDVTVIDVRNKTSVTDWIVIATGSSSRHVKSLANSVVTSMKDAGKPVLGVEGEDDGEWVLVDLGDVIVHVMQQQVREFYDLESLWSVDVTRHRELQQD
jgi:ribosome-associated protein